MYIRLPKSIQNKSDMARDSADAVRIASAQEREATAAGQAAQAAAQAATAAAAPWQLAICHTRITSVPRFQD